MDDKMYLTMREVAQQLGVSERTVRTYIDSGDLPHSRIGPSGKTIRIAVADLREYMEARRKGQVRKGEVSQ